MTDDGEIGLEDQEDEEKAANDTDAIGEPADEGAADHELEMDEVDEMDEMGEMDDMARYMGEMDDMAGCGECERTSCC